MSMARLEVTGNPELNSSRNSRSIETKGVVMRFKEYIEKRKNVCHEMRATLI